MEIVVALNGEYYVKEIEKQFRSVRSKGYRICKVEVSEDNLIFKCVEL